MTNIAAADSAAWRGKGFGDDISSGCRAMALALNSGDVADLRRRAAAIRKSAAAVEKTMGQFEAALEQSAHRKESV